MPELPPRTVRAAGPRPIDDVRQTREDEWATWFRNLGRQTRALRELLGVSQNQLARVANVSQGAISRFERGAGLFTPAIVVFKLALALVRHYRATGLVAPADALARMIDDVEALVPVAAVRQLPPLARDPQAEEVQLLFRAAPPRAREAVLAILRSFCAIGRP